MSHRNSRASLQNSDPSYHNSQSRSSLSVPILDHNHQGDHLSSLCLIGDTIWFNYFSGLITSIPAKPQRREHDFELLLAKFGMSVTSPTTSLSSQALKNFRISQSLQSLMVCLAKGSIICAHYTLLMVFFLSFLKRLTVYALGESM